MVLSNCLIVHGNKKTVNGLRYESSEITCLTHHTNYASRVIEYCFVACLVPSKRIATRCITCPTTRVLFEIYVLIIGTTC